MNIAKFAVTRPVAVVMRIAALVLLGAICLTRLPVDLLPKVSVPTVAVITSWPNVAPEEIEAQVTRPIEEAVSSATNLYQVNSSTSEGSSSVRIRFQWGTDIGQAAEEVLQLVQRASRSFPSDPTLQTPLVFKFDPTQLPILVFGVSGESDPVKLRTLLDNQITPMIESANGVASAVATGGQQRAIIIDVDPDRLRAHGLSLADVMRRITQENVNLPAGIAKQGNTEYTIRSLGWFTSTDEVAGIPVGSFNGRLVKLEEVASVRDSHPETRLYTRLDGNPSAGIVVSKQSGANTVDTAEEVFKKLDRIKQLYPHLKLGIAYDQSKFINNSVNDVKVNALIGAVLAVLILLFFLRNIRSTMVVALSIPTSIISTFALLYLCGFTINTMSLGGLALATGLIVDDAVVVLENIFRHIERDRKTSTDAAIEGTNEIMSAVFASTWTVMVVFLPLLLIKGQAGQMFTQFALVVIFSLAVSLLDATTVVPMLATDSGDFSINIKMPPGTALAKTDETMRKVEQIVAANPNVETAFSTAGSNLSMRGTSTALIPYQGALQVKLKDNRKQTTLQVISDLRRQLSRLPGAQARLTQFDLVTNLMTGGNVNVEVDIFGDDLAVLSSVAQDVISRVRGVRGIENLDVNWQDAMPEIQWRVDRQKALQLGISFSDIANTINTATNGTITSYYQ